MNLLHLSIVPGPAIDSITLQRSLDLAQDWFRYSPVSYMIWTAEPSYVWSRRLHDYGGLSGHSFVVYTLEPQERQGWMPKEFWNWLDKIAPQSGSIGDMVRSVDPHRTQKHEPGGVFDTLQKIANITPPPPAKEEP